MYLEIWWTIKCNNTKNVEKLVGEIFTKDIPVSLVFPVNFPSEEPFDLSFVLPVGVFWLRVPKNYALDYIAAFQSFFSRFLHLEE
jgi:hypothetical protein